MILQVVGSGFVKVSWTLAIPSTMTSNVRHRPEVEMTRVGISASPEQEFVPLPGFVGLESLTRIESRKGQAGSSNPGANRGGLMIDPEEDRLQATPSSLHLDRILRYRGTWKVPVKNCLGHWAVLVVEFPSSRIFHGKANNSRPA